MPGNVFTIGGRVVAPQSYAANLLIRQAIHAIEAGAKVAGMSFLRNASEALTWDPAFAEGWILDRERLARGVDECQGKLPPDDLRKRIRFLDLEIPDFLPPGIGG